MNAFLQHIDGLNLGPRQPLGSNADRSILDETSFHRTLSLETKRALRSQKPFVLCLFKAESSLETGKTRDTLHRILNVLDLNTRETDITGWYRKETVLGVMFTEITIGDRSSIETAIMSRINGQLRDHLSRQQFSQLEITCRHFPEETFASNSLGLESEPATCGQNLPEHELSDSPVESSFLIAAVDSIAAQNVRS